MHLIITIVRADDEQEMTDDELINQAQHDLLDLWEEADWKVRK